VRFGQSELDRAATRVTHGIARQLGHGGGDTNLILGIETEQGTDLACTLARRDDVAILCQLQT
jgi:hypothetical protein